MSIFLGYTYRWIAIRDENDGHHPTATPLYAWLEQRNLLDAANPPLKA